MQSATAIRAGRNSTGRAHGPTGRHSWPSLCPSCACMPHALLSPTAPMHRGPHSVRRRSRRSCWRLMLYSTPKPLRSRSTPNSHHLCQLGSAIFNADSSGSLAATDALLAAKASLDLQVQPAGDTALILAAQKDHTSVVEALVMANDNIEASTSELDERLAAQKAVVHRRFLLSSFLRMILMHDIPGEYRTLAEDGGDLCLGVVLGDR